MKISKRIGMVGAAFGILCGSATAQAHGVWGHVQVTAWAIDNLPPGDLRDMFQDHDVFNAALYGAAFTDSGYSPGQLPAPPEPEQPTVDFTGVDEPATDAADRADWEVWTKHEDWKADMAELQQLQSTASSYSEHTHWEPYIQQFIEVIREEGPPPYTHLRGDARRDAEKRVAFMMGCAAHGLQDEIFDSLFLLQTQEEDGHGQSEVDPASDGFLGVDGYARFIPEPYVPMDTVLKIYEDAGLDIDQAVIERSMEIIGLYLSEGGRGLHQSLAGKHADSLPWTRNHYMDTKIPGSLRSEIVPTGRYMEAIWLRLQGEAFPTVVATYPDAPHRRLLGNDAGSPDSWVTFILGAGTAMDTITPGWTPEGSDIDIPFSLAGTRWGAQHTRLIRLQPSESLTPGAWYQASVAAGAEWIGGGASEEKYTLDFQAPCEVENDPACPELEEVPNPRVDAKWPAEREDPEPEVTEPDPEPGDGSSTPEEEEEEEEPVVAAPRDTSSLTSSGCAASAPRATGASPRNAGLLFAGLLGAFAAIRRRRRA
jgi:MYXO-CTERM domain-containing protein